MLSERNRLRVSLLVAAMTLLPLPRAAQAADVAQFTRQCARPTQMDLDIETKAKEVQDLLGRKAPEGQAKLDALNAMIDSANAMGDPFAPRYKLRWLGTNAANYLTSERITTATNRVWLREGAERGDCQSQAALFQAYMDGRRDDGTSDPTGVSTIGQARRWLNVLRSYNVPVDAIYERTLIQREARRDAENTRAAQSGAPAVSPVTESAPKRE